MSKLDELQLNKYTKDSNCRIEYTGEKRDCVAIYLTSNNLFFPHTDEIFWKAVVEKDRYEWTKQKISYAQKHIFLRDIYKQWYASGINSTLDSIDKVVEWLKVEVKDYTRIVCLGSSGGGYFASILGAKLKADIVLNFNGQWDIYDNIERDGRIISPVLKRMLDNHDEGVKYFNISREEFDYPRTFYFVSTKSSCDAQQLALVKNFSNIHVVRFCNSHHGIPFLKCSLPRILNMNYDELCQLEHSEHLPILFDMRMAGILPTIRFMFKMIKKKLKI